MLHQISLISSNECFKPTFPCYDNHIDLIYAFLMTHPKGTVNSVVSFIAVMLLLCEHLTHSAEKHICLLSLRSQTATTANTAARGCGSSLFAQIRPRSPACPLSYAGTGMYDALKLCAKNQLRLFQTLDPSGTFFLRSWSDGINFTFQKNQDDEVKGFTFYFKSPTCRFMPCSL